MSPDPTEPTETYDDGAAMWDLDPFEVSAVPARSGVASEPAVVLDGRTLTPPRARTLARVLAAAADHAQGPDHDHFNNALVLLLGRANWSGH